MAPRFTPPWSAALLAERSPIHAHAGIGLRFPHHRIVAESRPDIAWFEVHTENYRAAARPFITSMSSGAIIRSRCTAWVCRSAARRELTGASLRVRGCRAIEPGPCRNICRGAWRWNLSADLLPPSHDRGGLESSAAVDQVQNALDRRLLIENPSSYRILHSTIPEWEFLAEVAARTGCGILCDVNNVYVSACNHGWDPSQYLAGLPAKAVGEIHLAGHTVKEVNGRTLRIDDHGSSVSQAVWSLYAEALKLFGPVPTLIEWDTNIPAFDVLLDEATRAERALECVKGLRHADAA
jgi:uncharacterized protein (UPF0276 family)